MRKILIANPSIDRKDISSVKKVLKTGNLAQGPMVARFEKDFSTFMEGKHCIAVNSGTSALHVALLALGIGVGDEVIVPSFTFAATANSVALTGAKPIFVDIDEETFNLNPNLLEAAITPRTRAIQVVHLYGLPANMPRILEIAKRYNLKVIEDAAQAHLASINNKNVGTFGDAATFSFYPTKNMTAGEGGMIVVSDPEVARNCRLLRNQGMETRYQNEIVGFNLRMTDIHAALGVSQLTKLTAWTEKRIKNAAFLSRSIRGLSTPKTPEGYRHVFHQYTVRVRNNRESFIKELEATGIGASVYYPTPVHKLLPYSSSEQLPVTELLCREVVSIPVHPALSRKDLKRIADGINRITENGKFN
jgi:perosamine synthetase